MGGLYSNMTNVLIEEGRTLEVYVQRVKKTKQKQTNKQNHEDTAGKWQSASQEGRSQERLTLSTPSA